MFKKGLLIGLGIIAASYALQLAAVGTKLAGEEIDEWLKTKGKYNKAVIWLNSAEAKKAAAEGRKEAFEKPLETVMCRLVREQGGDPSAVKITVHDVQTR